jgi:hypothetical protein
MCAKEYALRQIRATVLKTKDPKDFQNSQGLVFSYNCCERLRKLVLQSNWPHCEGDAIFFKP